MNPKSINDLDPKLKETYERVMGTSLGATPATASPTPVMTTQEAATEPEPAAEKSSEPQLQVETPMASTNEGTTVSQVFRSDQSKTNDVATVSSPSFKKVVSTKKGVNKLLPIIIVGVVAFFIIYGVIWAKVLGLF
jgi:cell envelope opacity-associated protein A